MKMNVFETPGTQFEQDADAMQMSVFETPRTLFEQDADAIMDTLTFAKVEKHVVDRVTKKAATYGQDITVRMLLALSH